MAATTKQIAEDVAQDIAWARATAPTTWALRDALLTACMAEPNPTTESVLVWVADAAWRGEEVDQEQAYAAADRYLWPVAMRLEAR